MSNSNILLPAPMPATFNISNLNGANGFTISGFASSSNSGYSVNGVGDVNSDGIADIAIGGPNYNGGDGIVYVIYGNKTIGNVTAFPSSFNVSQMNTTQGFIITYSGEDANIGTSIAQINNVNGNGKSGIIIGGPNYYYDYGLSFVVYGSNNNFQSPFDLSSLNGNNGFKITSSGMEQLGSAVGGCNDVNGDGLGDIIIGAPWYGPIASLDGAAHVIFGNLNGFSSSFSVEDLDGNNGFTVIPAIANSLGYSVNSAGDINADGYGDIVVTSTFTYQSPYCYVVFGQASPIAIFNVSNLNGTNGFSLNTCSGSEYAGDIGDINNDGINDLGISNGHVVFGSKNAFPSVIDDSWFNGINGFEFSYVGQSRNTDKSLASSYSSMIVGLGDINGDRIDDFAANGYENIAIIFGQNSSFPAYYELNLNGNNGYQIIGVPQCGSYSNPIIGKAGDVNADGLNDIIISNACDSPENGQTYIVYGAPASPLPSPSPSPESSANLGAILGGVLGGVGALALLGVGYYYCYVHKAHVSGELGASLVDYSVQ
jgi:hypothetical protein